MQTKGKKNRYEVDVKNVTMPHNLEAEQAVLCSAMNDAEACINIVAKLSPSDFYSQSHKTIFEAVVSLYQDNSPVDIVTLSDKLETKDQLQEIGGISYLTTLMNVIPSSAYYESYVDIVKRRIDFYSQKANKNPQAEKILQDPQGHGPRGG